MNHVIHRYPLTFQRLVSTTMYLPDGGWSVAHVGMAHDQPQIWLRHFDPREPMHGSLCPPLKKYAFKVIPTGHAFPPSWLHAGTFINRETDEDFVWHVIYTEEMDDE